MNGDITRTSQWKINKKNLLNIVYFIIANKILANYFSAIAYCTYT